MTRSLISLIKKIHFIYFYQRRKLHLNWLCSRLFQVLTSAPSDNNLMLWRQLGANTTHENADVIMGCDVIFLATKPHIFPAMMAGLEITGIEEDPKSKLQLENGEASNPENVISPNTR